MLKYQAFVFLPVILLPIFMTLIFHPSIFIKRLIKLIIIISIIYIIAALPILILVELKFWALLIIVLPVIFRVLEILIKKLDIVSFFSNIKNETILNMLLGSIGALVVILATADLNKWIGINSNLGTWTGIWLSIIIFLLLSTDILRELDDKRFAYGPIFGIISLIVGPILKNEVGIVTYIFSWLIYILPYIFIPFLRKKVLFERLIFIFAPATTFVLLGRGGIHFEWDYRYPSILVLFFTHALLIAIYYFIERYKGLTLIKHFCFPVFLTILSTILFFFCSRYAEMNKLLSLTASITLFEGLIVNVGRLVSSIKYNFEEFQRQFSIDDIKNILIYLFGKIIGETVFNVVFGKGYNKVKRAECVLGTCICVLLPVISVLIINTGAFLKPFIQGMSQFDSSLCALFVFFMITSSITILDDIADLVNLSMEANGLNMDTAIKKGSSISVHYLFLILYYLALNLMNISKINIFIILAAILWMSIASLSLHGALCRDLTQPNYNNLQTVRHFLSVMLFGLTYLIMIYLAATNSVNDLTSKTFEGLFIKICYMIAVSAVLSKLVGFDTGIASIKIRKKYIRDALLFPFVLIGSAISFGFIQAFVQITNGDMSKFLIVKNFIIIFMCMDFSKTLIIAVLPATNYLQETLSDYLSYKSKRVVQNTTVSK